MKKELLIGSLTGFFLVGMIGMAEATPMVNDVTDGFELIDADGDINDAYAYYRNSGDFMYLSSGNNEGIDFNNGTVELAVESWLITNNFMTAAEQSDFILSTGTVEFTNWDDTLGQFTISATASGTWSVTPMGDVINFYAVKTSTAYAMYYVNPAEGTGSWSTYDIFAAGYGGNDPIEISHFTGYNQSSAPVPEPATMLLFGTGLVGLAVSRLRKKKK